MAAARCRCAASRRSGRSRAAVGFNVSHWSGPLARLTVSQNFTYGGSWTGLFGQLTYGGAPVFGFKTPAYNKKADGYARYVYIDMHNSVYGAGLEARRRQGAAPAQRGLLLQLRAADAAARLSVDRESRGPAPGDLERVTVMGPGVTPDVQWVGPGLGKYDPQQDEALQRALRPARRPGRPGLQERALIPSDARYTLRA